MARFSMFAAYRAAVSDDMFDLAGTPGARPWSETASFAPRSQSFLDRASETSYLAPAPIPDATFETTPLILPAEAGSTLSLACGCSSCAKASAPLDPDAPQSTGLLDQHGDTIATAGSITVDGPHIIASLDAIGDQDFFAVTLTEGQWYNIGQYLTVGGPSLIPLADAYIELYDSAGNLITSADGGGPNTPSGLDALLTYQADYTGTYYINARAYDQDSTNGTTGDFVGDYELFVDTTDLEANPYAYRPFYDTDSPLHSLDWGSQVDRTSRNPDGDNGTRPNPLAPDGNGPIITNQFGIEGKNVITYYFAKQGDVFVDEDPLNPGLATMLQAQNMEQWEKDAFRQALDLYEQVADVVYIEVDNRNEADFKFITYEGTPGVGASLLGRMSPPNEANEGQTEFNAGDVRWTEEGLQQGGFYFPTLVHELGHGHGMSHPHDNGGRSSIMPGADGGTGGLGGGYGDWGLSQQVFTIMSYNDGWTPDAPYNGAPAGHGGPRSGGITGTEVDHFGWQGTLAALDIAVIQDKYGVNEEWATGDDLYEIKDFNGAGNFYSTIWDGGGTDEIRYSGSADATIDLRAATLRYEEGGGGRVSYAFGLWGGFTIANGVTIENATGGRGDDVLNGNDAANVLSGGGGDDVLQGFGGADTFRGNGGIDTVTYAASTAGVTALSWRAGAGGDAEGDTYSSIENFIGSAFEDTLGGNSAVNRLEGGDGDDILLGRGGADVLIGGAGSDTVSYIHSTERVTVRLRDGGLNQYGEAEGDVFDSIENVIGGAYNDALIGSSDDNALEGRGGGDFLHGASGDDLIDGGSGYDKLIGGDGDDTLTGGTGSDTFIFAGASGADVITDFQAGSVLSDVIQLDPSRFSDFADVLAHTTDDGAGNTVISKSGVTITLQGVLKAELHSNDFAFALSAPSQGSTSKDLGPQVLPAEPDDKDPGAQVLPSLFDDGDAIICPVLSEDKVAPSADDMDPLVLPAEAGPKLADEAPVICQPGSDILDLEAAMPSLWDDIGRAPHHRAAHSDWAVLV